jgi:hypothetical protein
VPPSFQGDHDKPILTTWPSPVVPQGEHVTLHCDSCLEFDIFRLDKEDGAHIPELQDRVLQKSFLLGPVTPAHAGTYRCHSSIPQFPNGIPAPSDPLVIIVSGQCSCSEWKFTPLNIAIPEFTGRNVSHGLIKTIVMCFI